MTLTRAMRALGATTLAGALLLTAAPASSADVVRDAQWANQYFSLDKVWQITKGEGVTVAVIDSGVDATHPDLAGQVLPGYDPSGGGHDRNPVDEHGTGIASLIAGRGHDTSAGVVGLAPGVKILPIYKEGPGGTSGTADGIMWAVDHNAKVINISLAGTNASTKLSEAVKYAYEHDVLIVAGAGNDGAAVLSPANRPGVVAVGAVDQSQRIWPRSNYGPELMLTAPGVGIVAAGPTGAGGCGGPYCQADGTSESTAYVSAAAALVRAKFPKLTAGQVANRLAKSALVPAGLSGAKLPDAHYGYGIIRPYEALTQDIPAGSELGPLAKPDGVSATTAGRGTSAQSGGVTPPTGAEPDIRQPASKTPLILGGVAAVVVLVVIVIVIAMISSRRKNRAQGLPGQPGPAPYGAGPGWPPAQQQPYGQQSPPPGYPQQPPYQNPYQGGNQPH